MTETRAQRWNRSIAFSALSDKFTQQTGTLTVYPDEIVNSLEIHPNRQVYVIVSKLYGEFEMKRGKVLNPVIFSLFDAETGFSFGGGYSGEPTR
ncbi:hypothetical protein [Paenibacillus alkalitolerans]|uniref:hypothetical protein n=1 Tax=Paenibacillus alkalitolerans TaxID=2799335 RepID=UPI0018F747EB|nr:hypothetical protein [Paenibacillus alkalitolerans]